MKLQKYIKYYIFIYVLMLPILRYYDLAPGNDYYLLATTFGVLFLFTNIKMRKRRVDVACIFFLIWLSFSSICAYYISDYSSYVVQTSKNNFILCFISITTLCFLYTMRLDFSVFVKLYKYVCFFLIGYFFYQIVCISVLHSTPIHLFKDILHFTSLGERNGIISTGDYFRFSSLFSEPSHFSQYLSPLVVFYLLGYNDIIKKSIPMALGVSLIILFSISGTGIGICAIIWAIYLFHEGYLYKFKNLMAVMLVAIGLVVILSASEGIIDMFNQMTDSSDNKTSDRVTRGFSLFFDLPLLKQITGIGYQCVAASTKIYHMKLGDVISNGHNEYVSDISSILLTGGLIGFTYIISLGIRIYRYRYFNVKLMSCAVFGIFMSEASLGALTMFYVCLIFSLVNLNDTSKNNGSNLSNNTCI